MGRTTLKFGRRLEVYERMKEVCKQEDGFAVYEPGWSDVRLARMLGVTQGNIRGIREEMIGVTRRSRNRNGENPEMVHEVEFLQGQITILQSELRQLAKRVSYMEKDLGYSEG